MMLCRSLPFLLLTACAAVASSDGDGVVRYPEAQLSGPIEHLWHETQLAYQDLDIPVAERSREHWSVQSVNLTPVLSDAGGGQIRYYRCGTELSLRGGGPGDTYVSLTTTLSPDGNWVRARSRLYASRVRITSTGETVRQECVSTGVLEGRVLETLRRVSG